MKEHREKIRRVGLVANCAKSASREAVHRALALITRAGRVAAMEESAARLAGARCPTFPSPSALARQSDLLLVFGGDGTMLRAVRESHDSPTPILGINVGRLGFLTAVSCEQIPDALRKIWDNDFTIQPQPLLAATVRCRGKTIQTTALNDIVISHGAVSRIIELEVRVDGEALTRYRGDGLIVSSPAGSTAYSLSAGGPIVSPAASVFAITPICPHALSNRTVIIALNAKVEVRVLSEQMEIIVSADGQTHATVGAGDLITIHRARRAVNLLHLGGWSFFGTVRRKLHWSGSAV
ncbi:MAG: NAD(+)/NADH kinase [Verrucomicrobiota bacterium]